MNKYIISIIVLIVVSLIIFSILTFILVRNYYFKQVTESLKKRYNKLTLIDFTKKIIAIDHIGFTNDKYSTLSVLFNEFSEKYESELEKIKVNIQKLSMTIKMYDWKTFKVTYNATLKSLNNFEFCLTEIDKLFEQSLEYRNYISFIIVSYCENSKKMLDFFEKNISSSNYSNELITTLADRIKQHCININIFIDKPDLNKIMLTMKNFNNDFKKILNLSKNIYARNKELNYIDTSIENIENLLKNGSKKINRNDEKTANKMLTIIKRSRSTLTRKLKNNEFEQATFVIKEIIQYIINIKTLLKWNFISNDFLSKNKNDIINHFNLFIQESNRFFVYLNKIHQNMSSVPQICNQTIVLRDKLNILKKKCSLLIEDKNFATQEEATKSFLIASQIIPDIIEWTNHFFELIKSVTNKFLHFKKIITEISSIKFTIAQLKGFIVNNCSGDIKNKINKEIKTIALNLNEIEYKFNHEFDKTLQYNYQSLLEIKQKIYDIKKIITYKYYIKKYAKTVFFYSNILVFNENANIDLDNANNLYKENKYDQCLNMLLKQLTKHKLKTKEWFNNF